MLNTVNLVGRLGQDVTTKIIGETTLSTFSMATNRSYKKGGKWITEADWHKIQIWGKGNTPNICRLSLVSYVKLYIILFM